MNAILINKTTLRMEPNNKLEADVLNKIWKEGILYTRGESKDGRLIAVELQVGES